MHDKTKRKLVPYKGDKDPQYYGGFSSTTSAYSALVRVNKKDDHSNVVVKIPLAIANQIERKSTTVYDYISSLKIKGFETVILDSIKLGQLVRESDGSLFFLASSEYKHNAKELWVPNDIYQTVGKDLVTTSPNKDALAKIFNTLTSLAVEKRFNFYAKDVVHLRSLKNNFLQLDLSDQQKLLSDLIYILGNNAGYRDPIKKYFKTEKAWTSLQTKGNGQGGIKLSDGAEFIFQSPTGLFTRTISVTDLYKNKKTKE
ncbi:hypothetical protein DLJ48_00290 [Oenococcus sicerae]|uniref:CRISPR-associated endonuclease Cas9 PAM-interacting domain-containing protein n=1 Tax=Oenococcus sicerae TaxID=2203724 RepID=A0ABX5QJY1_9LACO|nr:Cas9 endonuclease PAM-interacting domain-containing protein [Oenococcus sicerae]QAS69082.2 hypothetical protein DLJ48_00290 [Oenococcus sicerae]